MSRNEVGLNLTLRLLLAFKINTAHDRFGEGRKLIWFQEDIMLFLLAIVVFTFSPGAIALIVFAPDA